VGKLELRGVAVFNRGLEDRDLTFYLDGRRLDRDDSNDDGYARVKHRFGEPGAHRLVVAYEDETDRKCESWATVFVWQKTDRILVVDIDDTLARTRKRYLFSRSSPDLSEPMDDAAEVLNELSRAFRIVYLTARPREWVPKTREWLHRNAFPLGPVLTWDVDKDPWSQEDYKEDRIDDLQDDFDCVTIGIGDRESDHAAYRERKLFTILLVPGKPPRAVKRGVRLPDWPAVRDLFARNPHLYERDEVSKTPVILPLWGRD
jgi:hypothetical protein